jgi:hypothetical protein
MKRLFVAIKINADDSFVTFLNDFRSSLKMSKLNGPNKTTYTLRLLF